MRRQHIENVEEHNECEHERVVALLYIQTVIVHACRIIHYIETYMLLGRSLGTRLTHIINRSV